MIIISGTPPAYVGNRRPYVEGCQIVAVLTKPARKVEIEVYARCVCRTLISDT